MKYFVIAALVASLSFSCQRSVTRVTPDTAIDLSGRWNDSDSRIVADKMISELMTSEKFKEYAKEKGRKPAIVVGLIRNKTSEHIDADNYIKKLEVAIYNSNFAEVVESETFRDKLRQERAQQQDFADPATVSQWGKEIGASLMLFGDMTSETDTSNKKRVVNYITTLYLTDIETGKRVWYGQQEIKKFVKN
ncbi:penicillin-binding protein activator LpoB [Chryseolinea lacunae]|uniref:Penicillin-binding protein activator LpoB n=1 Tax=Chryseolinea lacunae TaxID=2801331 RepID=A0ABS1L071_9BACT|nr:penicillin-binding protein activator LpoB [Chryseolinea lacunae]MBL0744908.1 penicillin-binding protein activator LpoB [Chryseolinea lacunae]